MELSLDYLYPIMRTQRKILFNVKDRANNQHSAIKEVPVGDNSLHELRSCVLSIVIQVI